MVAGSAAFAAYAREVAKNYPVNIASHRPLPREQARRFRPPAARSPRRVARGEPSSSRTCGTGPPYPLAQNLSIAEELLERCVKAKSSSRSRSAWSAARRTESPTTSTKLYSHPGDAVATARALGYGDRGYHDRADLRQRARRLQARQRQAAPQGAQEGPGGGRREFGLEPGSKPFHLVFHGGSGSSAEEIAAAVDYGVVKMNVDTDTQYAFTRRSPGHVPPLRRRAEGRRRVGPEQVRPRAPGARPAAPAWPPGSSRRARTCAPAGQTLGVWPRRSMTSRLTGTSSVVAAGATRSDDVRPGTQCAVSPQRRPQPGRPGRRHTAWRGFSKNSTATKPIRNANVGSSTAVAIASLKACATCGGRVPPLYRRNPRRPRTTAALGRQAGVDEHRDRGGARTAPTCGSRYRHPARTCQLQRQVAGGGRAVGCPDEGVADAEDDHRRDGPPDRRVGRHHAGQPEQAGERAREAERGEDPRVHRSVSPPTNRASRIVISAIGTSSSAARVGAQAADHLRPDRRSGSTARVIEKLPATVIATLARGGCGRGTA